MHQQLPKVELHCHLDGIPHPSMLRRLEQNDVRLPLSADAFAGFYPVQTFDDFVRWFQGVKPLEGNLDTFRPIEDHPIQRARELGLSFSINTDDPGAFENTMASEYGLLADVCGFTAADFDKVLQNSLAARFQPSLRGPAQALILLP